MEPHDAQPLLSGVVNRWLPPHWVYGPGHRLIAGAYPLIHQAERDGIPQVAPILAAFRAPPDEVRRRIGKGLWRQVHHSELRHNVLRGSIKILTRLDFATIMAIPTGALSEITGMVRANGRDRGASIVSVAAYIAKNRTEMREAVMLVRDTARMGGDPNPKWSLRRLREEHDRLAWKLAVEKANPTQWADPWEWSLDGFRFRRLVSNADFTAEGRVMRHCIAGYADRAKHGDETAFAIDGRERASVSFTRSGRMEIKGRYNKAVSEPCRRAASKMWAQFKKPRP